MAITDALGRVNENANITFEQMKSLLEADVKPVLNDIKIGMEKKAEKYDKEIAASTKETTEKIEKVLKELKKIDKDHISKLAKKYLNEDIEGEIQKGNKLLEKILNMMNSLNKTKEPSKEKKFDVSQINETLEKSFDKLSNVLLKSLNPIMKIMQPQVDNNTTAFNANQLTKLINSNASGFQKITNSIIQLAESIKANQASASEFMITSDSLKLDVQQVHIQANAVTIQGEIANKEKDLGKQLKKPMAAMEEMSKEAVHKGTIYATDPIATRILGEIEGHLNNITGAGLRGQALSPTGDAKRFYDDLRQIVKHIENTGEMPSHITRILNTASSSTEQQIPVEVIFNTGDTAQSQRGQGMVELIKKMVPVLSALKEKAELDKVNDKSGILISSISSLIDALKNANMNRDTSGMTPPPIPVLPMGGNGDCIKVCDSLTHELIRATNVILSRIEHNAGTSINQSMPKLDKEHLEKEIIETLNSSSLGLEEKLGKLQDELKELQGSNEGLKGTNQELTKRIETELPLLKQQIQANEDKKSFEERFRYHGETLLSGIVKKLDKLMSSFSEKSPTNVLFSGGNVMGDETKFRRELYETLFIQQEIVGNNREIQLQYEMAGKTLQKTAHNWENISKITGQEVGESLNEYVKYLRAGIKEQKVAEGLMKTSGNLAFMIDVKSEQVGETFTFWNNQLKLTTTQSSQMSRSVQEIGKSTGLVGDNLLRAVKASDGLLKMLKNAATLSAETARNFMLARAEAEKTGVGDEVDTLLKSIVSGADFINNADEGMKNILAVATGRFAGPGLFNELLMGRGGNRNNIKLISKSFKQLTTDLIRDTSGIEIKSLKQIEELPDHIKLKVDNVLLQMSKGKIRIGNVERAIDALELAGQSFKEQINALDKTVFSNIATKQEKILADQKKQNMILNENFNLQTAISEAIQSGAGRDLGASIDVAINKLKKTIPDFQDQLDAMFITGTTGIEIVKESLENTYDTINTQLEALGKDKLKFKSQDITAALADKTGAKYRQVLEDLDEGQKILSAATKATTDPMAQLSQELRQLNALIKGFTGGFLSKFINYIGLAGVQLITIIASFGTLIAQIKLAEFFLGKTSSYLTKLFRAIEPATDAGIQSVKWYQKLIPTLMILQNSFLEFAKAMQIATTSLFGIRQTTSGARAIGGTVATTGATVGKSSVIKSISTMTKPVINGISLTMETLHYEVTRYLKRLFGRSSFKLIDMLSKPMTMLFTIAEPAQKLGTVINETGSAFTGFGKMLSTAGTSMKGFFTSLGAFGSQLGPIAAIIATISGLFEGIAHKNKELSTEFNIISGLLTGSTKINEASATKDPNVSKRSKANQEMAGIAGAALQGSMVGGLAGSMFGAQGAIIGSIVGALAGAIIEAIKIVNLGGVLGGAILKAWEYIKEAFGIVQNAFISAGTMLYDTVIKIWKDFGSIFGGEGIDWGGVIIGISKFIKYLSQVASVIIEIVNYGLDKTLKVIWELIKPLVIAVKNIFAGLYKAISGIMQGNMSDIMAGIAQTLIAALQGAFQIAVLKTALLPMIILNAISSIFTTIGNYFNEDSALGRIFIGLGLILQSIVNYAQGVIDVFTGLFTFDFNLIIQGYQKVFYAIGDTFAGLGKTIYGIFQAIIEFAFSIPGMIIDLFKSIDWSALSQYVITGIINTVQDMYNYITNINWGAMFQSGINWLYDNWQTVITAIAIGIIGLPVIIAAGIGLLGLQIITAISSGIFDALGGLVEGIANYFDKNSVLGKVFGYIANVLKGISGLAESLMQLFSGNLTGAYKTFTNSLFSFGGDSSKLDKQRSMDIANKAVGQFASAVQEGTDVVLKDADARRKSIFGKADTTKKINNLFQAEKDALNKQLNESFSTLNKLNLNEAGIMIQTTPLSQIDKSQLADAIAKANLKGQNVSKATAAIKSLSEATEKLRLLEMDRKDQITNNLDPKAEARDVLQDSLRASFNAPNSMEKNKQFAKALWEYPNLAGLNGMQAVDQSVKALIEGVEGDQIGSFISDKKSISILDSSLTWEEKQVKLLEESNKLARDAIKARKEGRVEDFKQAIMAAASAQAAITQQEKMKKQAAMVQGNLALSSVGNFNQLNLTGKTKEFIDSVVGKNQPLNIADLEKKSQMTGDKNVNKQAALAKEALVTLRTRSVLADSSQLVPDSLFVGATDDIIAQMTDFWRKTLTEEQKLTLESSRKILELRTKSERIIAGKKLIEEKKKELNIFVDPIKKKLIAIDHELAMAKTPDETKKIESRRKLLTMQLANAENSTLVAEIAALETAMTQKLTPQQEASARIEALTGTTTQTTKEQLDIYKKELPFALRNAFASREAKDGIAVLLKQFESSDTRAGGPSAALVKEMQTPNKELAANIAQQEADMANLLNDLRNAISNGNNQARARAEFQLGILQKSLDHNRAIPQDAERLALFKSKEKDLVMAINNALPGLRTGNADSAIEISKAVKELANLRQAFAEASTPNKDAAKSLLESLGIFTNIPQVVKQAVISATQNIERNENEIIKRAREIADQTGITFDRNITATGSGIPTVIGGKQVPASAYTNDELQRAFIESQNEGNRARYRLDPAALRQEMNTRGIPIAFNDAAQNVITASMQNATNGMTAYLNSLNEHATRAGSLYTHDIHTESLLQAMNSKLEAIAVEAVLPKVTGDPEIEVRKKKIEETANNTSVSYAKLSDIAESSEENADNSSKTNELLEKVANALIAIQELLSPNQKGNRRSNAANTKNIFEEPYWEPMDLTEYQYRTGESVGMGIENE